MTKTNLSTIPSRQEGKMPDGGGCSPRMEWARLICDKRFGMEDYHDKRGGSRSDFRCRAVCLSTTA